MHKDNDKFRKYSELQRISFEFITIWFNNKRKPSLKILFELRKMKDWIVIFLAFMKTDKFTEKAEQKGWVFEVKA